MVQQNQKNKRLAFTIIECLIVGALVCILIFSFGRIRRLYTAMVVAASADHVAAVCHYLAHCAQARGVITTLRIAGENRYMIDDGNVVRAYSLPGRVEWGAGAEVYGPPLRPAELITAAVVGGEADADGVNIKWSETGAHTPGTIYLHQGEDCYAVSLPRAVDGVAHAYVWRNREWITRTR